MQHSQPTPSGSGGTGAPTTVDDALPQGAERAHDAAMHTCPTCGIPATSQAIRTEHGVSTADLLCANDHIWRTTWLKEGA